MAKLWRDIYQQHFQKYFKKPFDIKVYNDAGRFGLKLAMHDCALPGFHVYATMGLADRLAENEEDDFGEVILLADVPDTEVPALFVNALFFILQNGIPLGSRFAIGGIPQMQPAFAKRHGKTALYFTLADDEDEHFNKVRRGETFGRVYQAYFITADEDEYLAAYGPDEFDKRFEKLGEARQKLRRASCLKEQ